MRIKHLREDEKGSGLVLTLMVLLVLSILGLSIGALTIGSFRLSDANRDDTSAYYVAEAGAVAAYEEIRSEIWSAYKENKTDESFYADVARRMNSKNGPSTVAFDPQFGSTPTATIRTEKIPTEKAAGSDPQKYTIYSTGIVDGKKRTVTKQVTVKWKNKNTGGSGLPTLPGIAALLTQGRTEIFDGTIMGDMYTNSIEPGSFVIKGKPTFTSATLFYSNKILWEKLLVYPSSYKNLPNREPRDEEWDFGTYRELLNQITVPNINEKLPEKKIGNHIIQDNNGNLNITNYQAAGYKLELKSDVYIPKITSKSQWSLTIDTGGADYTILTDNLDLGGDIYVTGEGTLTIVVKNSFKINSGGIAINKDGNSSKLTLVYLGDTGLGLADNIKINGHVIVKKADISVNSIPINGVLLTGGNNVSLTGGNTSNLMLIAPNAAVNLLRGYAVKGTVIAKTFQMDGGASLTYQPINTAGFPFGSAAPAADPEPKDIISLDPIIEN
ncbi:MAG: PilX N-terminal domain-containing pilus assembly protein [Trichococcus sp.]|uniref:DUF7305 domain-containing protein n=1 Tax=Trichococcus sp. TaxID=1985464 RepID=UPI003C4108FD